MGVDVESKHELLVILFDGEIFNVARLIIVESKLVVLVSLLVGEIFRVAFLLFGWGMNLKPPRIAETTAY